MDLGIELYKCSIEDHIILLRRDMKRSKVFTMYGALPILRFLHASEHVTYGIYPLYPIERARVEGTIDIIYKRKPGTLQECMEKNLLAIEHYLTISTPQRNPVDVQLRGGDPEPTVADILGYYMAKLEQD